jgi:hypothetical protein
VKGNHLPDSHSWARLKFKIDGRIFFHRQCKTCRRDFVMTGDRDWGAAHVGLLGFDFLDEETSRRWLSEQCLGRAIPEEMNDRHPQGGRFRAEVIA